MIYSLRGVALLMLIAGVCLGIFAGTLIAVKRTPAPLTLEQTVEERVKLYQDFYDLDVATTDSIRRELQRHRRALRDMLLRLRHRHQDEFTKLIQETEDRIGKVLKSAGVPDDAPGEDGAGER